MKTNGAKQVAEFLDRLEHQMKEDILQVREIILAADGRLTEQIKWNAPSFCMDGDDRITFNLHGRGQFRLIFHRGAKKKEKPERPLIDDDSGLLEWADNDRAIMTFRQGTSLERQKETLARTVAKWIEATSGQ